MNKKMQAILDTKVGRGSAALWWLGQMGLVVKSAGTLIVIDYFAAPFPTRQVAPPVPAEEMVGVDAFLGTHNHIDHIDHPSWRIWAKNNPEAKFVFPRAHRRTVSNDGIADRNALGMNAGESVRIGDMTIQAIAASHEFLDRDQETADLAGDVRPGLAIPGHWDMFADNSADPALFEDYIEAKYKGKLVCRIPKVMEKIVIHGK